MAKVAPLEPEIRRLIGAAGPMPVADYMRLCLTHPQHGYYVTRDPLGAGGDFVTAPEMSQMFGELIGLWMGSVWRLMGAPENLRVVELGPGRATLMIDALRAARVVAGFREAAVVHLVEISEPLRRFQENRLDNLGVPVFWHSKLEEVPGGPTILVANEFIDALPVHQAIKLADGWHERVVGIGADNELTLGHAPAPLPFFEQTLPPRLRKPAIDAIYEWRPDSYALEIGRRVRNNGAALIIDYGHTQCAFGETLQAVARHTFADPLRRPGQVDLTAHVDFEALGIAAESIGGRVHGPVPQRTFLQNLGIDKRTATLKASNPGERSAEIDLARGRLMATGAQGMGELFKAIAITDPKLETIPGFEAPL
jgi:NADH dehydrogenase [ubiquinone] 1 alpha subcomplex assembly factor 7